MRALRVERCCLGRTAAVNTGLRQRSAGQAAFARLEHPGVEAVRSKRHIVPLYKRAADAAIGALDPVFGTGGGDFDLIIHLILGMRRHSGIRAVFRPAAVVAGKHSEPVFRAGRFHRLARVPRMGAAVAADRERLQAEAAAVCDHLPLAGLFPVSQGSGQVQLAA